MIVPPWGNFSCCPVYVSPPSDFCSCVRSNRQGPCIICSITNTSCLIWPSGSWFQSITSADDGMFLLHGTVLSQGRSVSLDQMDRTACPSRIPTQIRAARTDFTPICELNLIHCRNSQAKPTNGEVSSLNILLNDQFRHKQLKTAQTWAIFTHLKEAIKQDNCSLWRLWFKLNLRQT